MFQLQCLIIGLFTPQLGCVLFSTSPPMIGLVATILRRARGVPITYWAMDLNPDQLIAQRGSAERRRRPDAGVGQPVDPPQRLARRRGRRLHGQSDSAPQPLAHKLIVSPPWTHSPHVQLIPHDRNPFRQRHGLAGQFVLMYSGNHSPNPLTTVLQAALRFRDDDGVRFLFVGGGLGKREVEEFIERHRLTNACSLPYQPLSRSDPVAADVHLVTLGEGMVGIIHPCKVYAR